MESHAPPKLIVLEGPAASGKSSHADRLGNALRTHGFSTRVFHHPAPARGAFRVEAALFAAVERAGIVRRTQCDVIVADGWYYATSLLATALRGFPSRRGALERQALQQVVEAEMFLLPKAIAVAILDAPDATLDARLIRRGESPSDLHHAVRAAYRDAFPARLDTIVPATDVGAALLREALRALGRAE